MWLQLDVDTFDDSEIASLPALHQHVWTRLLCAAKVFGAAGVLRGGVATPQGLAAVWHCDGLDTDTVANALRSLETSGRVRRSPEGALVIVNWPRYQRDPTAAKRSRKWREARRIRHDTATVRERNPNAEKTPRQGQGHPDLDLLSPSPSGSLPQEIQPAPVGAATKARNNPPKPNGMEVVVESYRRAYVRTYGQEPAITAGDKSTVGRLLNGSRPADILPAVWPAKLAHLADRYLADADKFVVAAGHPLRLLSTRIAALATAGRGPATMAPTCPVCGEPLGGSSVTTNRGRVHLGCRDEADAPEESA